MLYCPKCKKDVFLYSVSPELKDSEKTVETMRARAHSEGKLAIFNSPPLSTGLPRCPMCRTPLIDKDPDVPRS